MQVMYAHLGLLEPGTAAVDRDGEVWCVWPDGSVGISEPITVAKDTAAVVKAVTVAFGPYAVLATGLSLHDCDGIASRSKFGGTAEARAYALECAGTPVESGLLGPELGVESIDGPNGLRRFARLVGGRLGPDGQPARLVTVGSKVRRAHKPGVGEVLDGPDAVGRWQVKFPHIPFPLWLEDDLEVVE